jgi:hypothetical protein
VASGTLHSTTAPIPPRPSRLGECVQLGAACALLLLAALVLALKHAPMLAIAYAASFGALSPHATYPIPLIRSHWADPDALQTDGRRPGPHFCTFERICFGLLPLGYL